MNALDHHHHPVSHTFVHTHLPSHVNIPPRPSCQLDLPCCNLGLKVPTTLIQGRPSSCAFVESLPCHSTRASTWMGQCARAAACSACRTPAVPSHRLRPRRRTAGSRAQRGRWGAEKGSSHNWSAGVFLILNPSSVEVRTRGQGGQFRRPFPTSKVHAHLHACLVIAHRLELSICPLECS